MASKYYRLLSLGDERVTIINNLLSKNSSMFALARMIQQEWKESTDIGEKTLTQLLNRYKADVLGSSKVEKTITGLVITTKINRVDVITRMASLEEIQRNRIQAMVSKEKELGGMLISSLKGEIEEYREILKDIQKIQFDLGIDEYNGPILAARSRITKVTDSQGNVFETQVSEAAQVAQSVLSELRGGGFVNPSK